MTLLFRPKHGQQYIIQARSTASVNNTHIVKYSKNNKNNSTRGCVSADFCFVWIFVVENHSVTTEHRHNRNFHIQLLFHYTSLLLAS